MKKRKKEERVKEKENELNKREIKDSGLRERRRQEGWKEGRMQKEIHEAKERMQKRVRARESKGEENQQTRWMEKLKK